MPVNIVNEKIYLILWFVFLAGGLSAAAFLLYGNILRYTAKDIRTEREMI